MSRLIEFDQKNEFFRIIKNSMRFFIPSSLVAASGSGDHYILCKYHNRPQKRTGTIASKFNYNNAQESFSGIRVIKSFVQEQNMFSYFRENSNEYRTNVLSLAKKDAIYFPSMSLLMCRIMR